MATPIQLGRGLRDPCTCVGAILYLWSALRGAPALLVGATVGAVGVWLRRNSLPGFGLRTSALIARDAGQLIEGAQPKLGYGELGVASAAACSIDKSITLI